jgi:hypothetical protein
MSWSVMIINLIVLMVIGIIGGNAVGTSLPKYDLGRVWNTIIGAAGGEGNFSRVGHHPTSLHRQPFSLFVTLR